MKCITLLFVFVGFNYALIAQGGAPLGPDIDLIVQTQNAANVQIKFELVPVSTEYCWDSWCWNFATTSSVANNTVVINGTSNCYWNGWDYRRCIDDTNTDTWPCNVTGIPSTIQPLRNGFYKMNIYVNNVLTTYFYYDNRDADLPKGGCAPYFTCDPLRSSIKYNVGQNLLYFHNDYTPDLEDINWNEFPKESILFLREIKICNPANFSPFWNNGLVVIPQKVPGTEIYEPFLVWGPHKDFQPTGYKIYWRYGGTGSFNLLQTVDANTFTFRHQGLIVEGHYLAEYKVQAFNNQGNSNFTNIASIDIWGFYKTNVNNLDLENNTDYQLFQNHPNPFNPSTTISYRINETGFVTIKIYDVLGIEVKTLVNEIKTPGVHYLTWEGDNSSGEKLTSGIYFYHLQAGSFVSSKKLIIQK